MKDTGEVIHRQDSSLGRANTSFGCHTTRSISGAGGSGFIVDAASSSSPVAAPTPAPAFGAPGAVAVAPGTEVDDVDAAGEAAGSALVDASGRAAARPLACVSLATRHTSECTRTRTVAHVGTGAAEAAGRPRRALSASASATGEAVDARGPSCIEISNEMIRKLIYGKLRATDIKSI